MDNIEKFNEIACKLNLCEKDKNNIKDLKEADNLLRIRNYLKNISHQKKKKHKYLERLLSKLLELTLETVDIKKASEITYDLLKNISKKNYINKKENTTNWNSPIIEILEVIKKLLNDMDQHDENQYDY